MGREGFLARFMNRFPRLQEQPNFDARLNEEREILQRNVETYNAAVERLRSLPPSVKTEVKAAVRAFGAIQRIEDDIFWRQALLRNGVSLEKTYELNDAKDEIDTQTEISAPKFPID